MEPTNNSDYRLDTGESYELPQFSFDSSPTNVITPPSLLHRPGYQRIASLGDEDTRYHGAQSPNLQSTGSEDPFAGTGLAIANLERRSRSSIRRVPFDNQVVDGTPASTDFLLSPSSTRIGAPDDSIQSTPSFTHRRNASSSSSVRQPFESTSDTEHLTPKTPRTPKSISNFCDPLGQ